MGERVDSASNRREEIGGVDSIFCPHCGGDSDAHPTGAVGHAPVDAAERRWLQVNGHLACSVYCASKHLGLSEKEAQLNRAAKTRANMRAEGLEGEADQDERVVEARLKQREEDIARYGGSVIADIEKLTSDSGEPHGLDLPDESIFGEGDENQSVFDDIVAQGGEE